MAFELGKIKTHESGFVKTRPARRLSLRLGQTGKLMSFQVLGENFWLPALWARRKGAPLLHWVWEAGEGWPNDPSGQCSGSGNNTCQDTQPFIEKSENTCVPQAQPLAMCQKRMAPFSRVPQGTGLRPPAMGRAALLFQRSQP